MKFETHTTSRYLQPPDQLYDSSYSYQSSHQGYHPSYPIKVGGYPPYEALDNNPTYPTDADSYPSPDLSLHTAITVPLTLLSMDPIFPLKEKTAETIRCTAQAHICLLLLNINGRQL